MKQTFFAFLLVFLLVNTLKCSDFPSKAVAVLVAGSNEFYNYRHQADVAHAYKNLRRHGVQEDNIIVMMYDDVARNYENIQYNTLFNRPYSENLYKNFHVDYRGDDVTPDVFFAVLGGDTEKLRLRGSGKFVDVNPQDNVFIYLTDHGATGIFGFPYDYLYADDLNKALKKLKTRCNKVFVFMEACEAGSMFAGYLDDVKGMVAITASDPYESSYAYYYVPYIYTYLGDESSINFLELMEKADPWRTTLGDLYTVVKAETKLSHVTLYGDHDVLNTYLYEFFGKKQEYSSAQEFSKESIWDIINDRKDSTAPLAIESKYVQRTIAEEKLKINPYDMESLNLLETEKKIEYVFSMIDETFSPTLGKKLEVRAPLNTHLFDDHTKACYANSIEKFEKTCFNSRKYNLVFSFFNKFYQLCSNNVSQKEIFEVIDSLCLV